MVAELVFDFAYYTAIAGIAFWVVVIGLIVEAAKGSKW